MKVWLIADSFLKNVYMATHVEDKTVSLSGRADVEGSSSFGKGGRLSPASAGTITSGGAGAGAAGNGTVGSGGNAAVNPGSAGGTTSSGTRKRITTELAGLRWAVALTLPAALVGLLVA